jgi:hypothetical protein
MPNQTTGAREKKKGYTRYHPYRRRGESRPPWDNHEAPFPRRKAGSSRGFLCMAQPGGAKTVCHRRRQYWSEPGVFCSFVSHHRDTSCRRPRAGPRAQARIAAEEQTWKNKNFGGSSRDRGRLPSTKTCGWDREGVFISGAPPSLRPLSITGGTWGGRGMAQRSSPLPPLSQKMGGGPQSQNTKGE